MNLAFILDQPMFVEAAFHPRKCNAGASAFAGAVDGAFDIHNKQSVGYRLFPHPRSQDEALPVFVLWHGNAELAAEYDPLAPFWCGVASGASLIVLDFPGYGWAKGSPSISQLAAVGEAISPDIMWKCAFQKAKMQQPATTIIVGRSIGSVAATAQCLAHKKSVHGLLLDAGIAALFDLPLVTGMLQELPQYVSSIINSGVLADPFANSKRLSKLQLPLLLLHGSSDTLVPVEQARANLEASAAPTAHKMLREWPRCGHNDVLQHFGREFFQEVQGFLALCSDAALQCAEQATSAAAAGSGSGSSISSTSSMFCMPSSAAAAAGDVPAGEAAGSSCLLQ